MDTRWIKGTQLRPEARYGWGWALWPKKAMVSGSFLGELSHETYRDELVSLYCKGILKKYPIVSYFGL